MFKKLTAFTLSFIFVLALFCSSAFALDLNQTSASSTAKRVVSSIDGKQYIEGEVIVKYSSKATSGNKNVILNKFSANTVKNIANGKYTLLKLNNTVAVKEFLKYARNNPNIVYASPNYAYEFPKVQFEHTKKDLGYLGGTYSGTSAGVNDAMIDKQWYHKTINLYDAWQETKGDPAIKVAVIDSGLDRNHPEFAGQGLRGQGFRPDTLRR